MTRQEEFDFAAKEAEKISAKIYKLYCGTNDEEDQKYFLDSREILDEILKKILSFKNWWRRINRKRTYKTQYKNKHYLKMDPGLNIRKSRISL